MQRWFFANDFVECMRNELSPSPSLATLTPSTVSLVNRPWLFCVQVSAMLMSNERMAVVGSCDSLGSWKLDGCVAMTRNDSNSNRWYASVDLPTDEEIMYRYLIIAQDPTKNLTIVRHWETHIQPRKMFLEQTSGSVKEAEHDKEQFENQCVDIFGVVANIEHVQRGWLTKETVVQFKFYHMNYIWKMLKARHVLVRITPLNLKIRRTCYNNPVDGISVSSANLPDKKKMEGSNDEIMTSSTSTDPHQMQAQHEKGQGTLISPSSSWGWTYPNPCISDCLRSINRTYGVLSDNDFLGIGEGTSEEFTSTPDDTLSTAFAFSEVSILKMGEHIFHQQSKWGVQCDCDNLVLFHLTVGDIKNTAYLIDLYSYHTKAVVGEPPYHLGYQYILPTALTQTTGRLSVPIMCASRHRCMGQMCIGYLIVRPMAVPMLDMRVSYACHWNEHWSGLDIGHRGCGKTFMLNDCIVLENTMYSVKKAVKSGADMVEVDVQLTKDMVPVLFHDYYIDLPSHPIVRKQLVCRFTLAELNKLMYSPVMSYFRRRVCSGCTNDDNLKESLPFLPLENLLEDIVPDVGFIIDIKWPQRFNNGEREAPQFYRYFERNQFVDAVLDVLIRKAAGRRIILSCFDVDICTMMRLKQNLWPVMLVHRALHDSKQFVCPVGQDMNSALYFARTMQLLGIVGRTEDLLEYSQIVSLAKMSGLVLFCYGDMTADREVIRTMRCLNIQGIIYSRMDLYNNKDVKKSVFLLRGRRRRTSSTEKERKEHELILS